MSGLTLEQAQERLADYYAAEAAILKGQRYQLGDRSVQRADLVAVQQGITTWEARVKVLTLSAQGRGRVAVPSPRF